MGRNTQIIGKALCRGDTKLKQVVLSESLVEISHYAFQGVPHSKKLQFPTVLQQ